MSNESALHLVDVKITSASRQRFRRAVISSRELVSDDALRCFLERVVVDSDGFLMFTASEDGRDPYAPTEEQNHVPALYGKWGYAEEIAAWLKPHAEPGGRIIFHSIEADGDAWGWEFDGRGRMKATGRWNTSLWGKPSNRSGEQEYNGDQTFRAGGGPLPDCVVGDWTAPESKRRGNHE